MNWKILGAKLAAAGFPAIAAGLATGPIGAAAALGAQLAEKLGVEATPDAIAKIMIHDPNTEIALRQIEKDVLAEQNRSAERMAEIATADVQDARQTFHASPMPAIVFFTTTAMVVAFIGSMMCWGARFDPQTWDFLKQFGPQILTVWLGACAYFIGSSLGSRNKELQRDADRRAGQ